MKSLWKSLLFSYALGDRNTRHSPQKELRASSTQNKQTNKLDFIIWMNIYRLLLCFRFKDHPTLNERYLLLHLLGRGGSYMVGCPWLWALLDGSPFGLHKERRGILNCKVGMIKQPCYNLHQVLRFVWSIFMSYRMGCVQLRCLAMCIFYLVWFTEIVPPNWISYSVPFNEILVFPLNKNLNLKRLVTLQVNHLTCYTVCPEKVHMINC